MLPRAMFSNGMASPRLAKMIPALPSGALTWRLELSSGPRGSSAYDDLRSGHSAMTETRTLKRSMKYTTRHARRYRTEDQADHGRHLSFGPQANRRGDGDGQYRSMGFRQSHQPCARSRG